MHTQINRHVTFISCRTGTLTKESHSGFVDKREARNLQNKPSGSKYIHTDSKESLGREQVSNPTQRIRIRKLRLRQGNDVSKVIQKAKTKVKSTLYEFLSSCSAASVLFSSSSSSNQHIFYKMFNRSKHGKIHGLEAFKMGGRETLQEPPSPNPGKEKVFTWNSRKRRMGSDC